MEKTLVKGLTVLEALANSHEPRGVSELARDLGLLKSNVHRILKTLTAAGYVARADTSGRYGLTLKVWELGASAVSRLDVRKLALPYLHDIKERTGETARLSILSDDYALCLEQIESAHPVRVQTPVGGKLLLYCSATGKALLAHQSSEFIDRIAATLEPFTPQTARNREQLLKDLAQVRKIGFAINASEVYASVRGVAAPVRSNTGAVSAAIGVSGPTERFAMPTLRRYGQIVKDAADRLSHELGYRSNNKPSAGAELSSLHAE